MTKTITKTAIAAFAATLALTGAAFAEEANLENIYAQMDANQAKISDQVNEFAQERVAQLKPANELEFAGENTDGYTVASR